MACSVDCGTYNLVSCKRNSNGDFETNREVNAFVEMKLENRFYFNIMKTNGVPIIDNGDRAFILGEAAIDMAATMPELNLRRPMKDGCINPTEKDAFEILKKMIHGLIEEVSHDQETLVYSVPANAINQETDADFHSAILKAIFESYRSEKGYKVNPYPINEGLALVYAELSSKNFTGVGISFGSGMVNVCFAVFGVPVFKFAIANSGDWIDKMAAKATGESIAFINKEKTKVDLTVPPLNTVHRAIQTQYNIMIEKTVQEIYKGITESGKKANLDQEIDVIIAGGTSMPNGFDILFREVLLQAKLPIAIGSIIRPLDPLYSVARGCLIAAENNK